jgi:hypothetical protein
MNQTLWSDELRESRTYPRRILAYVLLLLTFLAPVTPHAATAANHHDTIVILLDASGSMKAHFQGSNGSRMDAAKSALKTVIRQVPQTTQIGLLVFSSANLTNDWAFPLGPRDDAHLFRMLDSIEPRIDTPLGKYLKIAADRLLEERAKQFGYGTYRLIVVTDGEAQDANLVNRYTPEIIARGITVDVIGVAMNKAHTLATKVHSYRSANDSSALNRALSEVFAEVRGADRDAAGAEVFATIAGLPDGVATAMIQAVAATPNQPIGEKSKTPPPPAQETHATPAAPQAMAQPQSQSPDASQAAPDTTPTRTNTSAKRRGLNLPTIITILIVLSVFRRIARRGGGRR